MKANKWEVWGYSRMLKKFTALAYCKTKREAEELLRKWRADGFTERAIVQKRSK